MAKFIADIFIQYELEMSIEAGNVRIANEKLQRLSETDIQKALDRARNTESGVEILTVRRGVKSDERP